MHGINAYKKTIKEDDKLTPEELLEKYIHLINFHAKDLIKTLPYYANIDFNDLVNSGVIGLLSCYERFDNTKNTSFKTFAGFRVRGEMIDYLRVNDYKTKTLRDDEKELFTAIKKVSAKLNKEITAEDIAEELGITVKEYWKRVDLAHNSEVISYEDLKINGHEEEALSFIDNVEDYNDTMVPTYLVELKEIEVALEAAISSLKKREQIIIGLYYVEELSLKEVGIILNITESRMSQLLKESTMKMKAFIENRGILKVERKNILSMS